MKRLAKKLKQS